MHRLVLAQLPDCAAAHDTGTGLKSFINASYDYGARLLASESDGSRAALSSSGMAR